MNQQGFRTTCRTTHNSTQPINPQKTKTNHRLTKARRQRNKADRLRHKRLELPHCYLSSSRQTTDSKWLPNQPICFGQKETTEPKRTNNRYGQTDFHTNQDNNRTEADRRPIRNRQTNDTDGWTSLFTKAISGQNHTKQKQPTIPVKWTSITESNNHNKNECLPTQRTHPQYSKTTTGKDKHQLPHDLSVNRNDSPQQRTSSERHNKTMPHTT